jgi:hypothetical protein
MRTPTRISILASLLTISTLLGLTSCAPDMDLRPTPGVTTAPAPMATATPIQSILQVYNPAGVRPDGVFVDELLKKTMTELGITKPSMAGEFPAARVESIPIARDAFDEINDLFYKRGWTDGLPIVPPTEERVKEMLKGADLNHDFVIGIVDPMGGQATIEKIAVNAVMAGCRPAYMPILVAAVEAVTDPAFSLRGMATTTNPNAPMLIISGPITEQLDINYDTNALGRGWQANASIGRAINLIIQNIGGSWPGVNDMSSLGQPGEFAMCLAENEQANPWGPLHVDLDVSYRTANIVTVIGAEGTHNIMGIGHSSEGYLKLVADALAGMEWASRSTMLLIIAQDTAEMLDREGWTKETIKQFIYENARIPYPKYKERFIDTGMASMFRVPPWVFEIDDPEAMIPTPFIDQFLITVTGGTGEKSMLIPVWSKAVSKGIRLPWNWEELIQEAME